MDHDPSVLCTNVPATATATATLPAAANHRQATRGHPPPHHGPCDDPLYTDPPPTEPPPSYEDATHSAASPLLVGPPPDYGAFRAYVDPDESSEASTEGDDTEQYLPERIGQFFAFMVLIAIFYLFWSIIFQSDPDDWPSYA